MAQATYLPQNIRECVECINCIIRDYRENYIVLDSEIWSPILEHSYIIEILHSNSFSTDVIEPVMMDKIDCGTLEKKTVTPGTFQRTGCIHHYAQNTKQTLRNFMCCASYLDLSQFVHQFTRYMQALIQGGIYQINESIRQAIDATVHVAAKDDCNGCTTITAVNAEQDGVKTVDATGTNGLTYAKVLEVVSAMYSSGTYNKDILFVLPYGAIKSFKENTFTNGCCYSLVNMQDGPFTTYMLDGNKIYVPSSPKTFFPVYKGETVGGATKDVIYGYAIARGALTFGYTNISLNSNRIYIGDRARMFVASMFEGMGGMTSDFMGGMSPYAPTQKTMNLFNMSVEVLPSNFYEGIIGTVSLDYGVMRTFPGGIVKIALDPAILN